MAKEDIITTDSLSRMSGAGGSSQVLSGSFSNKFFYYFEANQDSTISALSGFDARGEVVNWLTNLNCGTMKAGTRHTLPENCYIKSGTIVGDITFWKIK